MTEQGVTYQQVTVSEAAAILGVSAMTVRRMIRRGQLEGERVHRAQGSAYVVRLPADASGDATPTEQPARNVSRTNGTPPAPAEAIAAMMQATLTPIIAPLVAELAASRQVNERQAETIAELREDRGRLTERLALLTPSHSPVRARWARFWPALVFGAVCVLLVAVWWLVRGYPT